MVALSFASDAEANFFYKTATTTVANRSKRRRSRKFSPTNIEQIKENGIDSSQVMPRNPTGNTKISIFISNEYHAFHIFPSIQQESINFLNCITMQV